MKILLWTLFVVGNAATDDNGNYYVIQMPDEDTSSRSPAKQFRVFWNVPTMQCKSKGIPFEHLFERYGILQNDKDSFRGEKISILYDPGLFPALLKNESTGEYRFRNGGVPQEGDLEKHMASFRMTMEQSIPDPHFSGVGIIDFESWRPIFRQNFGVLVPYKDVSYQIERKKHWIWPEPWIKAEAKQRFEEKARAFMQTTLSIAKQMRPKAQWGYYGFPYCFNMANNNMRERCADRVPAENDDTYWLWLESTALYPSVYSSNTLTTNQLAQMVRGRLREAARVRKGGTPILPYFWFRYHNTNDGYLSEADLQIAIKTMYESEASGFILWGSSNDVNTVAKCKNLIQYVEKYLGPEVAKYTKYDRMESINDEISTLFADDNDHENLNTTLSNLPTSDRTISSTVTLPTTEKSFGTSVTTPADDESLSSVTTTTDDKTLISAVTVSTDDRNLSSAVTIITKDKNESSTLSTLLATIDEPNRKQISKSANRADYEYYDDDSEEHNKTTVKDVNIQLDSNYVWIRPENYIHNIKKQVDEEMKRKSYVSNIALSDKATTEATFYSSELDAPTNKEADNYKTQEDDLDKILIQSTTEDEFMDGLTTITEKGLNYDVENYESIEIMYDDVETNPKRNTNRLQDEKQDKIELQNERFGREFETYEVGSQFEDQLSERDGSRSKMENITKIATGEEIEVVTPNILNKQDRSYDRTERIENNFTGDELTAVSPKMKENNSNSIPENHTEENDVSYEPTSNVGTPISLNLYPNNEQIIPIIKDNLSDGSPVLPLHHHVFNKNTIKLMSDSNNLSDINASRIDNEPTNNVSKENRNSDIQTINIQLNLSKTEKLVPARFENDFSIIKNESASSENQLMNTTSSNVLLNFLKKSTSFIDYSDKNVNPTVEPLSILPLTTKYDKIITNDDSQHKTTTNGEELTTLSTIITNNSTYDKENIKKIKTPRASKNHKNGTTTESSDKETWNMLINSDQVTGSSAHRISGIRYYYCIIFYFFSVSKYYGQGS